MPISDQDLDTILTKYQAVKDAHAAAKSASDAKTSADVAFATAQANQANANQQVSTAGGNVTATESDFESFVAGLKAQNDGTANPAAGQQTVPTGTNAATVGALPTA